MKLRNLFYLLLALSLAFAACEELGDLNVNNTPKDVVLTVTTTAEEFDLDGGAGLIYYTLANASADAKVTATCEADWVSDITVATEYISYNVALNMGDARETKIVVSYETQSFEVAVSQAGKAASPTAPKFELASNATLDFEWESKMGTIFYTLENPIEGEAIRVKANVDWISDFAVKEGYIEFIVADNLGEAREGVITASYGPTELPLEFQVTIRQSEYVEPVPAVVIDSIDNEFLSEGGEGEIAYSIKYVENPEELVITCEANWITFEKVADQSLIKFTVAENTSEDMRETVVTLSCGELSASETIRQYQPGYNPNFNYTSLSVYECWAESENGGLQWDVTFIEKDSIKGEMQTTISFALAEANMQRITDGTYSVENGGILINTASLNGFSAYRGNTSEATDIVDATFEVKTNIARQVINIKGSFQAGNNIVTLSYGGKMRGMDLGEPIAGPVECNEWSTVYKQYHENGQLMFYAISADEALKMFFNIKHSGGSKLVPAGTYNVEAWEKGKTDYLLESKATYNNVEVYLKSGYITIEHISGGYKFTFDVVDENNRSFSGSYEGPIKDATNPA